MRYAERIEFKMARYLKKLATRYAERIKFKMARYLKKLATRYAESNECKTKLSL